VQQLLIFSNIKFEQSISLTNPADTLCRSPLILIPQLSTEENKVNDRGAKLYLLQLLIYFIPNLLIPDGRQPSTKNK
jgi:hypothetical protein